MTISKKRKNNIKFLIPVLIIIGVLVSIIIVWYIVNYNNSTSSHSDKPELTVHISNKMNVSVNFTMVVVGGFQDNPISYYNNITLNGCSSSHFDNKTIIINHISSNGKYSIIFYINGTTYTIVSPSISPPSNDYYEYYLIINEKKRIILEESIINGIQIEKAIS